MPQLIGTAPNQVPTNGDLGSAAYMDTSAFYGTGLSASFRNRIINGDMRIDQRNSGNSVSLTGVTGFVVDRWNTVVRTIGGGTITGQQISDAPAGFSNSTRLTVNTADSSLAALDYYFHWQKIEGFNTYDLAFGTSNASPVTVSFWVKSNLVGQFSTFLTNAAENYSCAIPYTINTANTWERKVVTFAGPTSGTWVGATNAVGLMLGFGLTSGTGLLGTPGVWGVGAYYGSVGDTNWMATSGNTWQITGVQLERGTVATPFEYRPYGTELALCQRYFQIASIYAEYASGTSGTLGTPITTFPVPMRVSPTITNISTAGSGNTVATYSVFNRNGLFYGYAINMTVSGTGYLYRTSTDSLSAEL